MRKALDISVVWLTVSSICHLAFFRCNDDGTVRGLVAVKGCCGCTCQHRHRFDVVGIDVGNGFGYSARPNSVLPSPPWLIMGTPSMT
jgi:hypothetical protein